MWSAVPVCLMCVGIELCCTVLCFLQDYSYTHYKPGGPYTPFCPEYEEWPSSHPNRALIHSLPVSTPPTTAIQGHFYYK